MHHNEFACPDVPEIKSASVNSNIRMMTGRRAVAMNLNLFLIWVVLGGTLFQLFGLPYVLHAYGLRAAWLLLPIMMLQPLHWGLIHEAIHSHLLPNRRADEFCARLLSVTLGVPFDATRFSHLIHHRYSRHGYDRPDVYDASGSYALAWLHYWGRLFGGVYLGILISPLIAFVPMSIGTRLMERKIPVTEDGDMEVRRLFVSLVTNPVKRRRTRRAFAMTLALYGASAYVYGAWWPMLLATMYVRGLWHSIADNVAHHDVALDEPERARNYKLPRALGFLVANQHLHLTHHLHPAAPWTSLAMISVPGNEMTNDNYFRAAFRQVNRVYPRSLV
jgi:fatty acid desaturase